MEEFLEINTVRLEKLNNDEFTQFIKSVLAMVENTTIEKLHIKPTIIDALHKCQEELTEASRQNRQNEETTNINQLDKQRGKLVVFLLTSFRNERQNVIEDRKEAAIALYSVSKNFLGIQSLPARQKTQTISALLKDLSKESHKKHIITLGLSEAVESLEKYNLQCQKLIDSRSATQSYNSKTNTKKIRKDASALYRLLTRFASASYLLNNSKENTTFIELINKLIADTMTENKKRLAQISSNKKTMNISTDK
ncbi:MAG: DUF6261 family protein [Capnocytophaga sp.]|nr:DUF6261 family protein [Capnocytophaga sp.]